MKLFNLIIASCLATMISCNKSQNETKPADLTLKVISFNMRYGEADDGENSWENRRAASPAMIHDQSPDIFGVQEPYYYQIQYMESECPEYKSVGIGRLGGHNYEHMSIFYKTERIELIDWGTFWLSETPSIPSLGWDGACTRSTTWALMKDLKNEQRFFFVNTHLDHIGAVARQKGLELILEKIAFMNSRNYPVVLTGDFNMLISDPAFDLLRPKMTNAREATDKTDNVLSYNNWGLDNQGTIDFIWYNGFSSCEEFHTITEKYANIDYISDHYPIYAILKY